MTRVSPWSKVCVLSGIKYRQSINQSSYSSSSSSSSCFQKQKAHSQIWELAQSAPQILFIYIFSVDGIPFSLSFEMTKEVFILQMCVCSHVENQSNQRFFFYAWGKSECTNVFGLQNKEHVVFRPRAAPQKPHCPAYPALLTRYFLFTANMAELLGGKRQIFFFNERMQAAQW